MSIAVVLDLDPGTLLSLPPEVECTPMKGVKPEAREADLLPVMPARVTMTSGLMTWRWGAGYEAETDGCRIVIGEKRTYHLFLEGPLHVTPIDMLEIKARFPRLVPNG